MTLKELASLVLAGLPPELSKRGAQTRREQEQGRGQRPRKNQPSCLLLMPLLWTLLLMLLLLPRRLCSLKVALLQLPCWMVWGLM